jgi:CO/xanthine dehydrogenase FAD-binding subunit
MYSSRADVHIYQPETLNELLKLYQEHPDALLWAGGTALVREQEGTRITLPKKVIRIIGVEELQRISRTERYLEIGACVPVSRIIKVGQHVLPKAFEHALRKIGPPALRNMATIGGNICHRQRRLNTFGILSLLDTKLEIRKAGGSRWITMPRLFSKTGELTLEEGEVVTRLRIPFVDWNLQFFQKIGNPFSSPKRSLTFTALTEVKKGVVTDFRMAVTFLGTSMMRDRELEAFITGKKVPLIDKRRSEAREMFRGSLAGTTGEVTIFQKQRALRLLQWYLSALHEPKTELAP